MATNTERTERTRRMLISTARDLIAQDGYAATSTPMITREAGVSRGALYHHFVDKAALFRAVIDEEQERVASVIERVPESDDPVDTLLAAGEAFLDAMRDQGSRRLIYVEGPAVLGEQVMRAIDAEHGGRTLAEGIHDAIAAGSLRPMPAAAMADLLSAAYDRAAAENTPEHREAIRILISSLRANQEPARRPPRRAAGTTKKVAARRTAKRP